MLKRIKRLFNTDRYLEGSIRLMDSAGGKGEKHPAFDHRHAIRAFNSWVYSAASINAFACAATPLRLYVKKGAGTKVFNTRPVPTHRKRYLLGDSPTSQQPSPKSIRKLMEFGNDFEEVADNHPILDLLSNVNPVYNGFDLTATRILYGELTGNAYHAVVYDEALGVPVQMWTMPSQWTFVQPDPDVFIKGYAYAAPGNQPVEFTREEIIHFRRPNPNDLFYGMGKVEAAWGTVGVNQAIHDMDLSTFANHARPDYAVVVKGPTGESSLKRFEEYVSERLQGTRKAGRFLTMTGDVQLTPLNFPPKDLSGREEVVEEIAAVFGVPVSMLKANDPNLASAQTGFAQWREGTILPLLRMDEDELNQTLIPMFGLEGDAMLCYDNPVPRDEQFELTKMQSAVSAGWMTINEARESQGMEPLEEELADTPLVNGMPLGGASDSGFMDWSLDEPLDADDVDDADVSRETEPEEQPQPVEEELPEDPGHAVAVGLNGAQIASVVGLLDGLAAGSVSPVAAVELIEAAGVSRESAERMVASQVNMPPAQQVEQEIEAEAPAAEPEAEPEVPEGEDQEDQVDQEEKACCSGKVKTQSDWWSEPFSKDVEVKEAPHGFPDKREFERRAAKFERDIDRVLRGVLKDIQSDIDKRSNLTLADAKRILERHLGKAFRGSVADASRRYLRGSVVEGIQFGDTQLIQAGFTAGEIENRAKARLEKIVDAQVVRLASEVTKYTKVRLADILQDGIQEGETTQELTRRVQDWAGREGDAVRGTRARARTIARTETARAAIEGQIQTYEESGVVAGKKWVLAPNPCQFCQALFNEAKVVGLRENFKKRGTTLKGTKGGTMKLDYEDIDGAPLHPNCRCMVEPVLRSEMP